MENQILWLPSYPKSGNTLLRYILIALFFTEDGNFIFSKSNYITQFDKTSIVRKNKNIFGKDLNKIGKVENFYRFLDQLQSKKSLGFKTDFIFLKTHAGLFSINNNPFTKIENTRGFIYIVRDPRDVCISSAKHNGISIDQSIDIMFNKNLTIEWAKSKEDKETFNKDTIPKSLMSSWDRHVTSWTSINWDIPYLVLNYEDLVYNKKDTLEKIVLFFEKYYNFTFHNINTKISNILKTTEFKLFKQYERREGFSEASRFNSFFSVGKKDQWKKELTNNQIKKIEKGFGKVMGSFNYKLSVEK